MLEEGGGGGNTDHLALELAQEAGVNTRTVRDIWNLRTWIQTTQSSWSPADFKRHAAACARKVPAAPDEACVTEQALQGDY